MDLNHQLRLPVSADEAWAALNDPRRVAPGLPGATVGSAGTDDFTGTLKIKLGPLALAFDGTGRYTERDAEARRLVVQTEGTDRRGHGTVAATHIVELTPDGDTATTADVRTALEITGRPAQLGRGVIADAVDRLVQQASSRMAARVSEGLTWLPEAEGSPGASSPSAAEVMANPVELGATFGDIDTDVPVPTTADAARSAEPVPRPSPQTPPRAEPQVYQYRPYSNSAEPHVHAVRSVSRFAVNRVGPWAGLGALAGYAALALVRRRRRANS